MRQAQRGGADAIVVLVILLLIVLVAAFPMPSQGGREPVPELEAYAPGSYRCSDPGLVLFGQTDVMGTPAVVRTQTVFAHVPEFQTLMLEGIEAGDARYTGLLQSAKARLANAVAAMASTYGHDVVAESGAIHPARAEFPAPRDRTAEVIDALVE